MSKKVVTAHWQWSLDKIIIILKSLASPASGSALQLTECLESTPMLFQGRHQALASLRITLQSVQ